MSTPRLIEPTLLRDVSELPSARAATRMAKGRDAGWAWAWVTRIGRRHEGQGGVCEDAAGVAPAGGGFHFALADGVSGGARGDVAAVGLVAHCLAWRRESGVSLEDWIGCHAETAVRQSLALVTPEPGAATLAAVWLDADGRGRVNRVGDCRAYLWRPRLGGQAGCLRQMLPDQTFSYMGYASPTSEKGAQPAHMVGNRSTGIPELCPVHVQAGEGLLLSSDGLHGVLGKETIAACLHELVQAPSGGEAEEQLVRAGMELVDRARAAGSEDDVSVLLALRLPGTD